MTKSTLWLSAVAVWVSACGLRATPTPVPTPTPTPTPAPTPTPTPGELLQRAAQAFSAMESAQYRLAREGAPAVLDPATGTTFTEAVGAYSAPDRVSARVKASVLGNVIEIQMLWLPEGNFISNPLTQTFQPAPAGARIDGAALFGPQGIPAILREGIENPALVGVETVEGAAAYHIRGEADGARLAPATAGALTAGVMYPVDVWMAVATSNLIRVRIAEPDGNGWLIDLFAINEPVDIQAP